MATLRVRLSESDLAELNADAARRGLTRSQVARERLLAAAGETVTAGHGNERPAVADRGEALAILTAQARSGISGSAIALEKALREAPAAGAAAEFGGLKRVK